MHKPKIAILSGHYGPGTGAHFEDNDEYTLARRDAIMLYAELMRDEIVTPMLEPEEDTDTLTRLASIRLAAQWAQNHNADAVLEFHYNSAMTKDGNIQGNEIVAPAETPFAKTLDRYLAALPNRHRAMKFNDLYLFKQLPKDQAVVVVESAFIWEPQVTSPQWSVLVAAAVKNGLYAYFKERQNA